MTQDVHVEPRTQPTHAAPPIPVETVTHHASQIGSALSRVLLGKPEVVRLALVSLLAEGHLLIEDVPGTGKTSLAKGVARCIDGTISRVQFTPDLMPSDVTGVSVYQRDTGQFTFRPGPVFATVMVADEINRASPKTQSALLEAMEERQVTVDGHTHPLSTPFLVLATQNPVDMEGTYPLPEAQRDRFFARTAIGYPDHASEVTMLADHALGDPVDSLSPVVDSSTVADMIAAVSRIHIAPALRGYVVDIVSATRHVPQVRLGCSPRAVLHLGRAAQAAAALAGRDYVIPDDIQHLAVPVLAHRLLLAIEAHSAPGLSAQIIRDIVSRTPVPLRHGD